MTRIGRFLGAAAVAALLGFGTGAPALAQSEAEAAGIRATILSQLDAIGADDWDLAFTYAAPVIQRMFRDPEGFSDMVINGYPMVWRPSDVRVGQLRDTPRGFEQTMILADQSGRIFVADYLMKEIDGVWRIAAVRIRPAEAGSA